MICCASELRHEGQRARRWFIFTDALLGVLTDVLLKLLLPFEADGEIIDTSMLGCVNQALMKIRMFDDDAAFRADISEISARRDSVSSLDNKHTRKEDDSLTGR